MSPRIDSPGWQSSDPGQALEALAIRFIYPVSPMQNSLVFPIPIRYIHEQRIIDSSCSNRLSCSTIRSLSLSSSNFQPLVNSVRVASGYHSGAHFVNPRPPHSWGVESALSFLGLQALALPSFDIRGACCHLISSLVA